MPTRRALLLGATAMGLAMRAGSALAKAPQPATAVNPLRHFLVIVRGVFLRGMEWSDVARNVVPLLAIAAVTLTAATVLFRKRME